MAAGLQEIIDRQEKCHAVRDYFAQLSNPLRLQILCALSMSEASVTELTQITGARQPHVSQQLNYLRLSGMVSRTRKGNLSVYRIDDTHIQEIMDFIAVFAERLPRGEDFSAAS